MSRTRKADLPVRDRILSQIVVTDDGHWFLKGKGSRGGKGRYATMTINGKRVGAHVASYEAFKGPLPEGHEPDHLCRVTECICPDHLEAVTPAENARRAAAAITHCPKGHPYDEANTYRKGNRRVCRECGRTEARERQRRRLDACPTCGKPKRVDSKTCKDCWNARAAR